MSVIIVIGLYCYPVKSCRGLSLQIAEIGRIGMRFDRQWMVVDEQGMFVAQRGDGGLGVGIKTMCLIETSRQGSKLALTAPEMPALALPLEGSNGETREVQVWKSKCEAIDQGDEAAGWLTAYLSRERQGNYRLVRMTDEGIRKAKHGESELAFADAYPFLVISQASLDDLNGRLAEPLSMNRFRPNIVLGGSEPYAEDRMRQIRIGALDFFGMTLCVRCPITTTNQLTAERGKEPLRTLATYRKTEDGVVFGRNFNHRGVGAISLGDRVDVLECD